MPEIAKKAVLDLRQKAFHVDGAEFPWLITAEGPTLNNLCSTEDIRSVTLTFLVEDVEVIPEDRGVEAILRRVRAADMVMMADVVQLVDLGLPVWTWLSADFGVSQETVVCVIADGRLDAARLTAVIEKNTGRRWSDADPG